MVKEALAASRQNKMLAFYDSANNRMFHSYHINISLMFTLHVYELTFLSGGVSGGVTPR